MVVSLKYQALVATTVSHPAIDRLNLTWNDLRICFELRKMNTQLFQKYFNHIRYWNWPWISEHVALDESFINVYCRHVDWVRISRHQRLTPAIVAKFETDISWVNLSANPHLTIDIIRRFATRLDWSLVCKTIVLDEVYIEEFLRYIDWYELSLKSPLKEKFIEKYAERVHWPRITAHQVLSDDFIDKHADRVDWDYISRHRPMDRKFIEGHAANVDWGLISDGQVLGEPFILDHQLRLDWEEIAYGQKISEEFFEDNAPKTPEVWAAFTAGRRLTTAFIARNIAHLPAWELTRFQTFTLAELDTYAEHLDWHRLSLVHPFTRPDTNEIDEAFIRRHASRFNWPQLVRSHVLSVGLLLEFRRQFAHTDIQQDIPIEILQLHPELINREWISQNCPLTVDYLRVASRMVFWAKIMRRHLSEEIVTTFAANLNLSAIPVVQPPMSPEWITAAARTDQVWATAPDIDPRYWSLYESPANVKRIGSPADEFFRRNQTQLLSPPINLTKTCILLKTMVSAIHLCPPLTANVIRLGCALNELNVPSSWDFIDQSQLVDWEWLVRTHRLSEEFLWRFQDRVDWTLVYTHQVRPFSERFIRAFHTRLDFTRIQLPYDVTMDYLREFGSRHNWAMLTRDFQEWQMEQFSEWCDFRVPPNRPLSEAFIKRRYPFNLVAMTQPMSEAYIARHDMATWGPWLTHNTKVTLSQKFIMAYRSIMINAHWVRASNHTVSSGFVLKMGWNASKVQTEVSPYTRLKLMRQRYLVATSSTPDNLVYDHAHFWAQPNLPEPIIRRYIRNVDWSTISKHQRLSPEFLAEFKDKLDWAAISQYQRMPESTIRRFKDYVIWPLICRYQTLSETFIAEFADRVSWEPLSPFSACFDVKTNYSRAQ